MKRKSAAQTYKRVGAGAVIAAMLAQSAVPAYAVSPGYAGFVSQVPGVYTAPPDPNVMFTLDDSASMLSDAVPDYLTDTAGMPAGQSGAALAFYGNQFPGLWIAMNDSEVLSASAYRSTTYYHWDNAIARYVRSSAGNPLYYNPAVTYKPWPKPDDDKQVMDPANVAAVRLHPTDPFNAGALTINLTVRVGTAGESNGYWPATYFVYNGTTPLPHANPNTVLNVKPSFAKLEITDSTTQTFAKAGTRTDCAGSDCTRDEELQNFANWLQYYRTRMLMAKGGVATAFAKQGTNLRVGFTTINTGSTMRQGVQSFAGARRTSFYTDLYARPYNWGGTPLRQSMDHVGQYFMGTGASNPWAYEPSSGVLTPEYSCRKSFHIMSTDGFWNGSGAGGARNNNNDNFSGNTPPKPDTTVGTYSNSSGPFSIDPFRDSNSNTLADVAAYYWKTDLRSTLANNVQTSARDPAYWQHLTTFTVGLGITGTGLVSRYSDGSIAVPASEAASSPYFAHKGKPWLHNDLRDLLVANKTRLTWTTPSANDPRTGDDLVHAAMNGRGRYYSATNPTDLANGLASALTEVTDQSFDLAAVAVDSAQLIAGGHLYQSTYSPSRWYGRLYAFNQNDANAAVDNKPTDGTYTNLGQAWEASNKMPAPDSRNIFTYNPAASTKGRLFTWADLSTTQQTYLMNEAMVGSPTAVEIADGQARLNYLRGSGTSEIANGGSFRDRSRYTVGGITGGVLGDVVNGSPIKGPDRGGGYDRLPSSDAGKALYSIFRSNGGPLANMRKTVFLGANDGMLHAFNVNDGVERFAYVPNAVYNVPRSSQTGTDETKLKLLSDPAYNHRFTVDGPPNIADAFIGGKWKTLLIGSHGAGARGIFTMDVTNTEVGAAADQFDATKIMWEFTEADEADMGFVPAYPHIARMRFGSTGKWVVIFGNGYDSTNGQAKLYILDLADGTILKQFSVGAPGNNGLSQPNFLLNSEREVTAIYAGDLRGNMWKFHVDDPDSNNWKVAFGSAPYYTPLFSTPLDGTGNPTQPITVMPELTAHTENPASAMVSFGTGRLFEASDTAATGNINLNTQALYGVWDKPGESGGMTVSLLKQHVPNTSITPPAGYEATSTGAPNWAGGQRGWYYQLETGGERVNVSPQQVSSTLFMLANKPVTSDPCVGGGSAKIFALNPVTGEAPAYAVFDTNSNGTFEASELGLNVRLNSSGVLTQPIFQTLTSATAATSTDVGVAPDASVDRGQATAARLGGVELGRSSPNKDCNWYMTASKSDTTLLKQYLQTCVKSAKARISWRQLI
jgi:type IV pilus assembly protein PilY1